ncbi:MAG: peptide chain release factor 1 [Planctomycetota bacterium]
MIEAFEVMENRLREVESLLQDPAVAGDRARQSTLFREHGLLTKKLEPYRRYLKVSSSLSEARALASGDDAEMAALAVEETASLEAEESALRRSLEDVLIAGDDDFASCIVEIRAGTGGAEAALFAGDLFRMYTMFARDRRWQVEEVSFQPGDQGGFKEVVFGLKGEGAWEAMRHESGGHRVQRVPETEAQGRIHTSAATVAVLPEPDDVQVEIRDEDIEWERMRAGGAGGQHVNKTESAVRIRHIPTGLEVKCQDERSQHKNYDRAMRILKTRLFELQQEKLHQERSQLRRSQIGSGDRNERIRTYNFPQNRITDHRVGLTLHTLDLVMEGQLCELFSQLAEHDRKERLARLSAGESS